MTIDNEFGWSIKEKKYFPRYAIILAMDFMKIQMMTICQDRLVNYFKFESNGNSPESLSQFNKRDKNENR